jgi:DNA-binding XRE family transcriptional regulator
MDSVGTLPVTNHLKEYRNAQRLALYGLAALAKVSPTTISAIEKWNYQPRPDVRIRLAKALDVNVWDIWPMLYEAEADDEADRS